MVWLVLLLGAAVLSVRQDGRGQEHLVSGVLAGFCGGFALTARFRQLVIVLNIFTLIRIYL